LEAIKNKFFNQQCQLVLQKLQIMSSSTNLLTGVILGAAAGCALGFYLNSEGGKQLRKEVADKSSELAVAAKETINDEIDSLKAQIDVLSEKAKNMSAEAAAVGKDKVKQATNKVQKQIEKV